MISLLCFVFAIIVSPFKPMSRLEAEHLRCGIGWSFCGAGSSVLIRSGPIATD